MQTEPKYYSTSAHLGHLLISFKGENWGDGLKDTEVTIDNKQLCWITWYDKELFLRELNEVIEKYRI